MSRHTTEHNATIESNEPRIHTTSLKNFKVVLSERNQAQENMFCVCSVVNLQRGSRFLEFLNGRCNGKLNIVRGNINELLRIKKSYSNKWNTGDMGNQ